MVIVHGYTMKSTQRHNKIHGKLSDSVSHFARALYS